MAAFARTIVHFKDGLVERDRARHTRSASAGGADVRHHLHPGDPRDPAAPAALVPDHARHHHRRRRGGDDGHARQGDDRGGAAADRGARHQRPPDPSRPGLRPRRRRAAAARLRASDVEAIARAGRRREGGRAAGAVDRAPRSTKAPTGRRRSTARPATIFDGRSPGRSTPAASSPRPRSRPGKAVCIIGNTVRTNLFRGGEPGRASACGSTTSSCEVIGALATRGQAAASARSGRRRDHADQGGAAPLHRQSRHPADAGRRRSSLLTRARCQASISDLLRERRSITGGKDDDFNIFDTAQISDTLTGTTDAADRDRRRGRGDQPGRRRHRHHEHHARLGDRAHARDRHPPRDRRGRAARC